MMEAHQRSDNPTFKLDELDELVHELDFLPKRVLESEQTSIKPFNPGGDVESDKSYLVESAINFANDSHKWNHLAKSLENRTPVDIQELLVFANDFMWSLAGKHTDGLSVQTRGPLYKHIAYPRNNPAPTNCKAFNDTYVLLVSAILEQCSPELSSKIKLVSTGARFGPDVHREYDGLMTSSEITYMFNQPHAHIMMLVSVNGEIRAACLDPYHQSTRAGLEINNIQKLEKTNWRKIDTLVFCALIQLYSENKIDRYQFIIPSIEVIDRVKELARKETPSLALKAGLLELEIYRMALQRRPLAESVKKMYIAFEQRENGLRPIENTLYQLMELYKLINTAPGMGTLKEFGNDLYRKLIDKIDKIVNGMSQDVKSLKEITTQVMREESEYKTQFNTLMQEINHIIQSGDDLSNDTLIGVYDLISTAFTFGLIDKVQIEKFHHLVINLPPEYRKDFAKFLWFRLKKDVHFIPGEDLLNDETFAAWIKLRSACSQLVEQGVIPIQVANHKPNSRTRNLPNREQ